MIETDKAVNAFLKGWNSVKVPDGLVPSVMSGYQYGGSKDFNVVWAEIDVLALIEEIGSDARKMHVELGCPPIKPSSIGTGGETFRLSFMNVLLVAREPIDIMRSIVKFEWGFECL